MAIIVAHGSVHIVSDLPTMPILGLTKKFILASVAKSLSIHGILAQMVKAEVTLS